MSFQDYNRNITTGRVLRYAFLPDIASRLRYIGVSLASFVSFFAWFLAQARLIDKSHPCLRPENIGKYRLRDIIGLAMRNLVWDRYHIPEIAMFCAIIASIIFSITMIIVSVAYFLTSTAHAQRLFSLGDNQSDHDAAMENEFALDFLARVFGETGMNIFHPDEANEPYSWLTVALGEMLQTYSNLMLFIGGLIVLYYVVIIVVESAQTGVPLGQRFSVWAPIRLAIAIALLVPMTTNGYNGAQLIVFQTAAWGSNFATNVWGVALDAFLGEGVGSCNTKEDLVGPNAQSNCPVRLPEFKTNLGMVKGLFLIYSCQYAYNKNFSSVSNKHKALISKSKDEENLATIYSVGTRKEPDFCGQYRVFDVENRRGKIANTLSLSGPGAYWANGASIIVQKAHLGAYKHLLNNDGATTGEKIEFLFHRDGFLPPIQVEHNNNPISDDSIFYVAQKMAELYVPDGGLNDSELFDVIKGGLILKWVTSYEDSVNKALLEAVAYQNTIAPLVIEAGREGGWANAGAYYVRLSDLNGTVQTAMTQTPEIIKLPKPLGSANVSARGKDEAKRKERKGMEAVHGTLRQAQNWWMEGPGRDGTAAELAIYGSGAAGNIDVDEIQGRDSSVDAKSIFKFFDLSARMKVRNESNPLSSLTTMGASLTATAVAALAAGALMTPMLPGSIMGLGFAIMALGSVLLAAGITLYIVLPILPFIYFTFAVITWVIAIFEAVVGAPLWALSFLRIDGDGITGPGAMNGVYLLFMLFLHPTLIIFGLVGSIIVFSAAVTFFNETFTIVTEMMWGDRTGIGDSVGGFFMMIIYVIVVYALAQSIFKMVDSIPRNMLRFLGQDGAKTFSETQGDAEFVKNTIIGVAAIGQSVGGKLGEKHEKTKKPPKPKKPQAGAKPSGDT